MFFSGFAGFVAQAKTAFLIHLHRELHGFFSNLRELEIVRVKSVGEGEQDKCGRRKYLVKQKVIVCL